MVIFDPGTRFRAPTRSVKASEGEPGVPDNAVALVPVGKSSLVVFG